MCLGMQTHPLHTVYSGLIPISVPIHLPQASNYETEGTITSITYTNIHCKGKNIRIKLLPGYTVWSRYVSAFQNTSTVHVVQ